MSDNLSYFLGGGGGFGDEPIGQREASFSDLLVNQPGGLEVVEGERPAPEGVDEDSIVRTERETTEVGDLLQEFYELDRQELIELQERLFAGGFYGQDAEVDDVAWGEHDEVSFDAWTLVVLRAARFNAAGRDITTDDVMQMAAESANLSGDAGQERKVIVQLDDPAAIARMVDTIMRRRTGRKGTPEEQREMVAMIHELQREWSIAQAQAIQADSGTFTIRDVDVEARLENEIRRRNPTEVEGFQVGRALETLENLIGQL